MVAIRDYFIINHPTLFGGYQKVFGGKKTNAYKTDGSYHLFHPLHLQWLKIHLVLLVLARKKKSNVFASL